MIWVMMERFFCIGLFVFRLGDGRGLASGFYQSIVLGEKGPTLNMNNTFSCFYQNWNLVEFICCFLDQDIRKTGSITLPPLPPFRLFL